MDPELPESPDLRGHWQTQGMIKAKYPVETTTGRYIRRCYYPGTLNVRCRLAFMGTCVRHVKVSFRSQSGTLCLLRNVALSRRAQKGPR